MRLIPRHRERIIELMGEILYISIIHFGSIKTNKKRSICMILIITYYKRIGCSGMMKINFTGNGIGMKIYRNYEDYLT